MLAHALGDVSVMVKHALGGNVSVVSEHAFGG